MQWILGGDVSKLRHITSTEIRQTMEIEGNIIDDINEVMQIRQLPDYGWENRRIRKKWETLFFFYIEPPVF